MAKVQPIQVWRFEQAPKKYQKLSTSYGDEDWLALVPSEIHNDEGCYLGWLDAGTSFGCASVKHYKTKNGVVYIGSHA